MKKVNFFCKFISESRFFAFFITGIIFLNCTLIGIETYFTNSTIYSVQVICLIIFTLEIVIRWFASGSNKNYWKDGWNIFDFFIVSVSYIPETLFAGSEIIIALRILRTLRVFRLLKIFPELKIITTVLIRSCKSLGYSAVFFIICIYFYAILGVTLFKLPEFDTANAGIQKKIIHYF